MAAWLRGDLREYSRELLLDRASFSQQRFRPSAIEALLDEHSAGADNSQRIWALLMLELWQAEVVAPRPAALAS
jgi:hypothetical protein